MYKLMNQMFSSSIALFKNLFKSYFTYDRDCWGVEACCALITTGRLPDDEHHKAIRKPRLEAEEV